MIHRMFIIASIILPSILFPLISIAELSGIDDKHSGGKAGKAVFDHSEEMKELLLFFEEEDLIVAATKSPKTLRDVPAVATVITAEEIRNMGARDIRDVIKRVPGMGVSNGKDNAQGLWSFESRGIDSYASEKILFMIDGHSVSNVFYGSGTPAFSDLMVENIKRVEVIRGPGSALHGTNALVAVINVVTKDAEDIDGVDVRAGAGSFDTKHYSLLYGKDHSGWRVVGSLDYLNTDGTKEWVERDVLGNSGPVSDWKEKYDLGLKVSKGSFYLTNRYVAIERGTYIGAASALNDESKVKISHFFTEAGNKSSVTKDLDITLKGYYDVFHFDNWFELFPEGTTLGPYTYPDGMIGNPALWNSTLGGEVQADYSVSEKNHLTIGVHYEYHDQYNVTHAANFDPDTFATLGSVKDITSWGNFSKNTNRTVNAVYLQDTWHFTGNAEGIFGVRYDKYNDFGDTVNPRLGIVWDLSEKATLKLLYGSAFRAPTLQELYNSHNPVSNGNENLSPEKISTYEAAIGYRLNQNAHLDLSYFHNDIKDLITVRSGSKDFDNVGKAVIDGIETELRVNLNKSSGYINYTYQDARDPDSGYRLAAIASHKGNIGFNLPIFPYLNLNSNLLYVGSRPRAEGDNRPEMSGYEVLDMTLVAKRLIRSLEIRFSAYNLLNEDFEDADTTKAIQKDYPREGSNFMVEARYLF